MQIHGLQQSGAAQAMGRPQNNRATGPVESPASANSLRSDELELSAEAQQLSSVQSSSAPEGTAGIRTEKIAALRQAIAEGSYETPKKMSAALDKMLDTFA